MSRPRSINGLRLFYESGETNAQITWQSVEPADATPEFDLLINGQNASKSIVRSEVERRLLIKHPNFDPAKPDFIPVPDGAEYRLTPMLDSPVPGGELRLVVHRNLQEVTSFGLDVQDGRLVATWKAPSGLAADSYEAAFGINDREQPLAKTTERRLVLLEAPVEGQRYVVKVRAALDNSFGPPRKSNIYTHLAGKLGTLARTLFAMLPTTPGSLELTPEAINEPDLTSLYTSLLGLTDRTIRLSNPTLSAQIGSLTISAQMTLLGVTSSVTLTFTEVQNKLHLNFKMTHIGQRTLSELWRLVQPLPSVANVWDTATETFSNISLEFDSAERNLILTGTALPTLTLTSVNGMKILCDNVRPKLVASLDAAGTRSVRASLAAQLRVGQSAQITANNPALVLGDTIITLGVEGTNAIIGAGLTLTTAPVGATTGFATRLVDSILGTGKFAAVATANTFLKPERFAATAQLRLNLTQETLLLSGTFDAQGAAQPRYGQVAVFIKRQNNEFKFLLAGALTPGNWNLIDISPGLNGLNDFVGLRLNQAAVAITNLDDITNQEFADRVASLPAQLSVKPGLGFFIGLDFESALLRNVKSILTVPTNATITGQIPSDSTQAIALQAELKNTQVVGNQIQLIGLRFDDVALQCLVASPAGSPPTRTRTLKVRGKLTLTVDNQNFVFQGDLSVQPNQTRGRLAVLNDTPFANPLGLPSLTLERLGAGITVDYDNNRQVTRKEVLLTGRLSFAAAFALKGTIGFIDNTARLVLIQLIELKEDANGNPLESPTSLQLSTLFNKVTGEQWPDALDVSLHDGELSWVPANQSAVTFGSKTYQPGFRANAKATVFGVDLDFTVAVKTTAPKGLTATAAFEKPIDWGFVRITGTAQEARSSNGPSLDVNTASQTPAQIKMGLRLLDTTIDNLTLRAGREEVAGTITLPNNAGPFAGRQLGFKWNHPQKKFLIEGWSVPNLDLPRINIRLGKNSGPCASVIAEAFPLDGSFSATVDMSISPSAASGGNAKLIAGVVVSYTMKALSIPVFTVNVPSINFTVDIPDPSSFTWSGLAQQITTGITNNASAISDAILEDPGAMAAIMFSSLGKEALEKLVTYVLCRGSASVGAAAGMEGVLDAMGAALIGGAVGAFAGFSSSLAVAVKPPRPAKPTLEFRDNKLIISWRVTDKTTPSEIQAAFAQIAAFKVVVKSGGMTVTLPQPYVHRKRNGKGSAFTAEDNLKTFTAEASQLTQNEICSVSIVAIGAGAESDPSEEASLLLSTPTVSLENQAMVVQWPSVARLDYSINLTRADGSTLGIPLEVSRTTVNSRERAEVALWNFPAGNPLAVKVNVNAQVKNANPSTPNAASLPTNFNLPLSLAAPVFQSAQLNPPKREASNLIAVFWNDVSGAIGYQARVLNQANLPLSPQPTMRVADTDVAIQAQTNPQARIAVRALGINGAIGPQNIIGPFPATITNISTRFRGKNLFVNWDALPGATYIVNVNDAPPQATGTQTEALIPALKLPPQFQVSVTAQIGILTNTSPAVSPTALSRLLTPQNLTAQFKEDSSILMSWDAINNEAGISYEVLVHDQEGKELLPQPAATVPTLNNGRLSVILTGTFVTGQRYGLAVYAVSNENRRPSLPQTTELEIPIVQTSTAWHEAGDNFVFLLAPNRDVLAIKKLVTHSKSTEVHTLSAASNYQQYSLHTKTALPETGDNFAFLLTNNRDIFAIKKNATASNSTEVKILTAASNYQQFALQTGTPLHETHSNFVFLLAENRDLFLIKKSTTGSRSTEVHVLSAASNYQQFSLHVGTPMPETGDNVAFGLAANRDLWIIQKSGTALGKTEIRVLTAASNYQQFGPPKETSLPEPNADFEFLLAPDLKLFVLQKRNTGTTQTQLMILQF